MTSPASLTITNNSATTGEVNVAWTETGKDGSFYSYRLYVREQTFADWTLAYEDFTDVASYNYDLYQFAANATTEVAVVEVTQSLTLGLVEGAYNVNSFATTGITGYYFINGADDTKNFYLLNATAHSANDEWEEGVFNLVGRGRKVDRGTHLGEAGQISAQLFATPTRTVRSQFRELTEIRGNNADEIFIRPPFGEVMKVAITGLNYDRVPGVGTEDYMNVTIDYVEVA